MLANIIYNFIGRLWSVISNFLFIPLYLKYLGVGNFAVVSYGLVVVSVLTILDLGFSTAISREVARADISDSVKYSSFKTLESFYIALLALCMIAGYLCSDRLSSHAIGATLIDRKLIELCLTLIIVEAGLQLCFRFYIAVLMGLESQRVSSLLGIFWGAMRNGGAAVVVAFWPTLEHFFAWQVLSTLLLVILARSVAARAMSRYRADRVPIFDFNVIRRLRGFVGGVWFVSVVAVINTQIDRILIGRLLPLEQLGYYTVAMSVGIGLLATSSPLLSAVLPRFTQWFSQSRAKDASELYLRVATAVSVIVFPAAAVIITSADVVLFVWTGNAAVVTQAGPVIPWVVGAYALLAVSNITYGVAIANAYTWYNNILGLLTLVITVPGYWFLIQQYGLVGAPILFAIVQTIGCFAYQFLINRRFLFLNFWRTCLQIFVFPGLSSLFGASVISLFFPAPEQSRLLMFLYLCLKFGAVLVCTVTISTVIFRVRWSLTQLTPVAGSAK